MSWFELMKSQRPAGSFALIRLASLLSCLIFVASSVLVALTGLPEAVTLPVLASEKTEWVFDQRDVEGGKCRVYVTDDAVHIHNLDRGFEILAAKPDWNVLLFRRQDKIYCTRALKDFRTFSPLGAIDIAWDRYSGLRPVSREKRKDLPFQLAKYKSPDHHEVSMIEGITASPQVGFILQCYYHCAIAGIPYESVYTFSGGHHNKEANWLNDDSIDFEGRKAWLTTSSWKKIAYNAADFHLPPGFMQVNDQTKILVSNTKIENMNSILKDIDQEEREKDLQNRRARLMKMQQHL